MLTHLLFSISALIISFIFTIIYFSYKSKNNSVRSKLYTYMLLCVLVLTFIEIFEGFTYVYDLNILFSLMWKLHSIFITLIIAFLFYYFLISIADEKVNSFEDLLWDKGKILSIKNIFSIIFVIAIIFSIIYIKTYQMTLKIMFYFYTNQSINYLLILYLIYFIYNFYIIYLKSRKRSFEKNDYIVLIGTFVLFIFALLFEYRNPEVSIYSTLFILVLILIYYFKENEDIIIIGELQKEQMDLYNSNNKKLFYLNEFLNDLDNPLNAFSIVNKKLENCINLSDEEIKEQLSILNYISNDLVSVANNQVPDSSLHYRIDKLVKNIEYIITPSLKQKPIEISYNIDQNIPSLLTGDRISVHRIISNLLVNAIENTEVGKIMLDINGEIQKDNVLLHIRVTDSGNGIKSEDFNNVFKEKLNDYDINKRSNLALTKKYVDLLNGNIHFDSYYGSGSVFYVDILQKIANSTPISEVPMKFSDIEVSNCNNRKVLLIDNDDYTSKKMTNILSKYNFVVDFTKNGNDAISAIKAGKAYDLIIVNENITDMNYMEIGKFLIYMKKISKIPASIVITSNAQLLGNNSGFNDFLPKPISLKKFDKIIKNFFGQ